MQSIESLLCSRLGEAFRQGTGGWVDPAVRRSQHADFQADGALAAGRQFGINPRELAARIVALARLDDLCEAVELAGPGFINLTVATSTLAGMLNELNRDGRLGVELASNPEVIAIDYSAPNVAKEMHVGHLRSTIIGDAVARTLEWLGHRVVRQNHLGDWGTPFGMLIEHLLEIGESKAKDELSVGDLNTFYRVARQKFDTSEEFRDRSRRRVVLLQSGDEDTRRLWKLLTEKSKQYFLSVYKQLDVTLTDADFAGESSYNDDLAAVVEELDGMGILRDSEGAKCVFPQGFTNREGHPLPLIVRKRDGGYGYATTDLAAVRRRTQNLKATRLLYVVGLPQQQHFEMIFEVATEAGWLAPPSRAEHVGFGSVLGTDGRMLRSRAGDTIKLSVLLDEAVTRAATLVAQKNSALDAATQRAVAHAVGIGAVKYADLSTDRTKDYVFDFDRMLSFEGNTGPYLQYAHARIKSIFRRAGLTPDRNADALVITAPAERRLCLELLLFGDIVRYVSKSLEFHRLTSYLFDLATTFTTFYEQCPVLRAKETVRSSRLVMCDLTARTLATGLDLLGIQSPDRM